MVALLTPEDIGALLQISLPNARRIMAGMDGVIDIGCQSRHLYRITKECFNQWLVSAQIKPVTVERTMKKPRHTITHERNEYDDGTGHCRRR